MIGQHCGVSELPPPKGAPVAYALHGDPWAEQARRQAAHRAERSARRRRRVVRFGGPALVLLLGGGAVAVILLTDDDAREPVTASSTSPAPITLATEATVTTTAAGDAASVEEVWLLDRGDGTYDWGAMVSSTSDVLRSDLDVTVELLDADGVEVYAELAAIAQLVPGGQAVIGGEVAIDGAAPTRIVVTADLGTATPDVMASTVAVTDVRRISSGQVDVDDRLLGAVDVVTGDPQVVRLAVLWRDEAGRVVAALIETIDVSDADGSTEFSVRRPRTIVPAGEPDDVVANVSVLN